MPKTDLQYSKGDAQNRRFFLFFLVSRTEMSNLDKFEMSKIAWPPTGVGRISATVPLVNYFLSK